MANATTIHRSFNRLRIIDYCILYFTIAGLLCGSIDRELVKLNGIDSDKELRIVILSLGSLITLSLLLSIVFRYLTEIKHLKFKGKLSYTDDLITTKSWKPMCFELLLYFWHPFPFLWNKTFLEWDDAYAIFIEHYSNDLLLVFMIFFRIFLIY